MWEKYNFFWPSMVESHTGAMDRPSQLYNILREKVSDHLAESTRARESGTLSLLQEVLPYCFKGDACIAPHIIFEQVVRLAANPRTSFKTKVETVNGESVTKALIHHWPSWLMMGSFKAVNQMYRFFYMQAPIPPGPCPLCGSHTDSFWEHIFLPCPCLTSVDDSSSWQDICYIIAQGYRGLALYAALPLISDNALLICPQWGE